MSVDCQLHSLFATKRKQDEDYDYTVEPKGRCTGNTGIVEGADMIDRYESRHLCDS